MKFQSIQKRFSCPTGFSSSPGVRNPNCVGMTFTTAYAMVTVRSA